jgi:mono/diheme cytochrome c family protein
MKIRIAPVVLASVSMLAPFLISASASAEDGGALFKAKCAACHGVEGQGKPPMAPKLAGTSKSAAEIVAVLTKGGEPKAPHIKPMSTVTPEQATALAAFVKTLK